MSTGWWLVHSTMHIGTKDGIRHELFRAAHLYSDLPFLGRRSTELHGPLTKDGAEVVGKTSDPDEVLAWVNKGILPKKDPPSADLSEAKIE